MSSGCNAILNRHNGTLTSPAFGHSNYPHNQKCTYKIRHPDGGKLSMIFSFLDIHPTDYVQVRIAWNFNGLNKVDIDFREIHNNIFSRKQQHCIEKFPNSFNPGGDSNPRVSVPNAATQVGSCLSTRSSLNPFFPPDRRLVQELS
jgi:hypothetical protein